jgi:hypothetical protein
MRVLSITEIECIVNRVLRRDDIFVMCIWGQGPYDVSPCQMVINHGVTK